MSKGRTVSPRGTARGSAVPTASDEGLASLARALGHPARVAILRHLMAQGECICGDIVSVLPLAQATVSQHLKVLKEAGLVRGEIDGPRVCYCADPAAVRRLKSMIADLNSGGSS
jgi:ArsR family transcriptional regulator